MMKVLGIIAEYNPFHYGHLYHLNRSKREVEADYTVAVMSGQFTQRGEAAIADKWIRAEAAVGCGVDLVLELPAVYAVQTAEVFAHGGVQLLNKTGLITHISFGSEIGDLTLLQQIADILITEDEQYKALLKRYLAQGLSYPAARYRAILDYFNSTNRAAEKQNHKDNIAVVKKALTLSNSILAIEYLKALKLTHSNILPLTIPRIRSSYSNQRIKKGITSAASIRREILKNGMSDLVRYALPETVFNILSDAFNKGMGPVTNNRLEDLFLGILRRSSLSDIASWMDVGEGLENRIREQAHRAASLDDFLSLVKTRRYTHTRLQRILIHGLLNLTTKEFRYMNSETGPAYLRILAFSKKAAPLLRKLKETAAVPIITKAAHITRYNRYVQKMFAYDCLATDLYSLAVLNPLGRQGNRDFTRQLKPLVRS
ncbi:MAG: nucleotidyltransferase [Caldicoprobacterales bacterium]|jgi:predicted nucleotidyltransferase|nr:nucleotidyltransferase [Clostridiales bacterium]